MANADKGYGQQDPSDSASDFNAQAFLVRQMIGRIATATLATVKKIDATAKTVDVQILVNQLDGQGNATPHGTIFGVPYLRWQGGISAIKMDPKAGDVGLLVAADRDISAAKANKAVSNPGSFRRFSYSDAVYVGGLLNADPQQWIEFTENGIDVHDKNSNVMTFDSSGITVNGVLFNRQGQVAGNLPVTGRLQLGGNITALDGTSTYGGTIHTTGTVYGDTGVWTGSISLTAHHHTAQGATAPTTAAQP